MELIILYDPASPPLGIYFWETGISVHKETWSKDVYYSTAGEREKEQSQKYLNVPSVGDLTNCGLFIQWQINSCDSRAPMHRLQNKQTDRQTKQHTHTKKKLSMYLSYNIILDPWYSNYYFSLTSLNWKPSGISFLLLIIGFRHLQLWRINGTK